MGTKTLIYLDPPYYEKGRELYYDFYGPEDHEQIHRFLTVDFKDKSWIISYDDVKPIRALYSDHERLRYVVSYSARTVRQGSEVMFFSNAVQKSALVGPLKSIEGNN